MFACLDIHPKTWCRVWGWRKAGRTKRVLKGTDPQLLRPERAVEWRPWNASLKSDIFIYSSSSLSGTLTCWKKGCEGLVHKILLCISHHSHSCSAVSVQRNSTNFINSAAVDAHEYERKMPKV